MDRCVGSLCDCKGTKNPDALLHRKDEQYRRNTAALSALIGDVDILGKAAKYDKVEGIML